MKKELSRRSGVQITAELMKLLGGRLPPLCCWRIERKPWLPVRHGCTLFRCCWYRKSAGREHPPVLRRHRGPLRGLRRSARGTAVSGAVRQPLYRLPAAGGASGQNLYQAPGALPRQAGKPPEGQPSHHDHGGHRNAGGVLCPHRFPRLHRRACVIGGDGSHLALLQAGICP